MKMRNKMGSFLASWIAPWILMFGMWGCEEKMGQISMSLTDAATDHYEAVYVTIEEVQVHLEGESEESWKTVATPEETFNLLELVNGVRETLGLASITSGHYTQVRLIVGTEADVGINILSQAHPFANYVIDTENQYHELKIPSGEESGVKVVHGFDINADQTTELILDFDASKSVVVAGNSGNYLLKPTIKILNEADFSIVSGMVIDSEGKAVAGAMVMAQVFDSVAVDKKDEVVTESSTVTDASGMYSLFLDAGTYNLVVSKVGFDRQFDKITMAAGDTSTSDFALTSTDTGNITGNVTIANGDAETYVTLSFRENILLKGELVNEKIEIVSLNVVNGGSYAVALPAGDYEVVRSSFGHETEVTTSVTVTAQSDTTLDISF